MIPPYENEAVSQAERIAKLEREIADLKIQLRNLTIVGSLDEDVLGD